MTHTERRFCCSVSPNERLTRSYTEQGVVELQALRSGNRKHKTLRSCWGIQQSQPVRQERPPLTPEFIRSPLKWKVVKQPEDAMIKTPQLYDQSYRAGMKAKRVKESATKPDDLSSILWVHVVGGRQRMPEHCSPTSTCTPVHTKRNGNFWKSKVQRNAIQVHLSFSFPHKKQ